MFTARFQPAFGRFRPPDCNPTTAWLQSDYALGPAAENPATSPITAHMRLRQFSRITTIEAPRPEVCCTLEMPNAFATSSAVALSASF